MLQLADCFVDKYNKIIKREFGIIDKTGLIISSTCNDKVGELISNVANIDKDVFNKDNTTFKKIVQNNILKGYMYIAGEDDNACELIDVLTILYIENVISNKTHSYNKEEIYSKILDGHIQQDNIREECQNSGIDYKKKRIVFVFKVSEDIYNTGVEVVSSLFPDKSNDIVFMYKNSLIVLIRRLKSKDTVSDFYKTAKITVETLNGELMLNVNGGIGLPTDDVAGIRESYNQAIEALYTGMAFENEKRFYYFGNLGLGRIIKHLDINISDLFLSEISKEYRENIFDEQTLFVAQKLFENNLNISEASRKSYLHRNTFMYRLEKLEKLTGLDLRKFDDAVIFKMAMLIKIYSERTEKTYDKA